MLLLDHWFLIQCLSTLRITVYCHATYIKKAMYVAMKLAKVTHKRSSRAWFNLIDIRPRGGVSMETITF